ncbi:arrestin domain-containing protein A-like [Ptychodera flava]|uniref:arrestin domain-containing protein A-like n=1 Tax=Ptychodera flava TaxID=63121 RepID=UPI003969FB73
MNQIDIRTERGEYVGGETVYGVVYLRINTATGAEFVVLKFKGYEKCECLKNLGSFTSFRDMPEKKHVRKDDKRGYENLLLGKKFYFNTTIKLWEDKGPLPRGHYVLPFQYQLPPDLPGNYANEGYGYKNWKGIVKYKVKAFVAELDEPLKHTQPLIIRPFRNAKVSPVPQSVTGAVRKCFCYSGGEVMVEIKLNKAVYTAGEVAVLQIAICNNSQEDIHSIRVHLQRTTKLLGWTNAIESDDENDNDSVNGTEYSGKPDQCVYPEAFVTVWGKNVEGIPKSEDKDKVIHNKQVKIPLYETLASQNMVIPVLPTTLGTLVRCAYYVTVDVDVPYSPDISVVTPIVAIQASGNEHWANWKPPDWVARCQVQQPASECSVRQSILDSDVFSTIPPFHPT